jgi:hypothetical protein
VPYLASDIFQFFEHVHDITDLQIGGESPVTLRWLMTTILVEVRCVHACSGEGETHGVTIPITARVHEARVSISRGGNQTSCATA